MIYLHQHEGKKTAGYIIDVRVESLRSSSANGFLRAEFKMELVDLLKAAVNSCSVSIIWLFLCSYFSTVLQTCMLYY